MEILRLPESTAIEAHITMPLANTEYTMSWQDLLTGATGTYVATSASNKSATFVFPDTYLTYSGTLLADFYDPSDDIAYSTGIEILKPYCDITSVKTRLNLNTTAAIQAEKVARKLIEAETGTSFQLVRKEKDLVGMGLDYLPIKEKIQKLYYVWENEILVHDYQDPNLQAYKISVDGTSIVSTDTPVNKMEYRFVWRDRYLDKDFAEGYDYLIDGDFGYKFIPEDIVEACELLVQDITSNDMRYINRYIEQFDNREFSIKFSKNAGSSGTGNLIADKILLKYKNSIVPGVI